MKYFLVEVKKPFGVYSMKAQIVMREKLVNGIFKKNIKVIKELSPDELAKEYNTEVKYKIEDPKDKKNTPNPNLAKDVIKKIWKVKTIEKLEEFNYENEELKEAIDSKRAELEENSSNNDDDNKDDTNTSKDKKTNAEGKNNGTDDTKENESDVEFEDMTTEELLQICNETYKMNKPVNTGRPNLLASLEEITKK